MMEDTIQEVIKDAHNMALHCADTAPDLLKWCFESIATRLERVCASGLYIAPKSVVETLKAAAADTPVDLSGKNLNAIFANPPFGRAGAPRTPEEEARERFAKWLSVPALGIQFKRLRSKALTKLVASWRDEFNDHIYEICVAPDGATPNCGWRAKATNDGHLVFTLTAKDRANCEQFALSAMKRYLKRGHRRTYRKLAKSGKEGK